MAPGPWYAAVIVSVVTSAASAVGAYYTAKANLETQPANVATSNEHRITKLEEDFTAHTREDDFATTASQHKLDEIDKEFGNVWCAINVNNHQPCRGPRG